MSNVINPSLAAASSISSLRPRKKSESHNSLKRSVIDNFEHEQYSSLTKRSMYQLFFFETLAMSIFVYGFSCSK